MKIDAGTSYLHASQRAQSPAAACNDATSFADVLATATATAGTSGSGAPGVKQVDFTNMTRQEMRDWSNGQIRSGKISLDDSRPFMAMTMKIPVSGGTGEVPAANDGERFDFTQKVRAGIEGAVSRNDDVTRQMLQSAMAIMQRYQG
ncbi:MAG: hypothetical protein ABIU18_00200 [Novosphingobium sp.]